MQLSVTHLMFLDTGFLVPYSGYFKVNYSIKLTTMHLDFVFVCLFLFLFIIISLFQKEFLSNLHSLII